VAFPLGSRTVFAEELIDTISKGIRIFPVNVNDQRRMVPVTVLNHERDVLELVWRSVRLELIGDLVGQVVKYLNWFLCHRLNFGLRRLYHHERWRRRTFQNHLNRLTRTEPSHTDGLPRKKLAQREQLGCPRIAIDDTRKRDIILTLFDFDGWLVAGVSAGNDHDVATFGLFDTIGLIADGFDGHIADLTLIDESNTFFYGETNLDGVLYLVSRSMKPVQELA